VSAKTVPIESKTQLIEYISAGCKPEDQWRIGTEHEKFGFTNTDRLPLRYAGDNGIQAVLEGLIERFDWEPVLENDVPIALRKAGCSVSLEPGGQLELSGAPLENLHQTCNETSAHLTEVKTVAEPLGVSFLGMGFHPKHAREAFDWMPKDRYRIMRNYMPKVGTLGLDMMLRTCTIQVNLDFESEADMVKKFRVGLALQPIATALFANSPFTEGKPNGFVSYRSNIWSDTDAARTGMLPFVFESGMSFERWVDYMLDVPMYFVYRDGQYLDASGLSFRDFIDGRLAILPGERPTMTDWEDHLTTAFPEVRLKRFLEMRGADGGPWRRICALPAFWVGLLYNREALDAAWDLVKNWSLEQRSQLRLDAPRKGFKASVAGLSVLDIAKQSLDIAHAGLAARAQLNDMGDNETGFLDVLNDIVRDGITPAERKLALYQQTWQQSVDPLFTECIY